MYRKMLAVVLVLVGTSCCFAVFQTFWQYKISIANPDPVDFYVFSSIEAPNDQFLPTSKVYSETSGVWSGFSGPHDDFYGIRQHSPVHVASDGKIIAEMRSDRGNQHVMFSPYKPGGDLFAGFRLKLNEEYKWRYNVEINTTGGAPLPKTSLNEWAVAHQLWQDGQALGPAFGLEFADLGSSKKWRIQVRTGNVSTEPVQYFDICDFSPNVEYRVRVDYKPSETDGYYVLKIIDEASLTELGRYTHASSVTVQTHNRFGVKLTDHLNPCPHFGLYVNGKSPGAGYRGKLTGSKKLIAKMDDVWFKVAQ